jgi:hypothetical protein
MSIAPARAFIKRLAPLSAALCLAACAALPSGSGPSGTGWTTLFDADSNLNDWTLVGQANWRLQDGQIQADLLSSKTPAYLVSRKTWGDFQLYAEVWVDGQTNSGFFVRCPDPQKIGADTCYEFNIWDSRPDPSYGTGAIVNVAKVSPMPRAGGRWNTFEATLKGDQLTFAVNGVVTASGKDSKLASGHVALQYGSGIVRFRKVMIRPIN